jgi:hypothetical protein
MCNLEINVSCCYSMLNFFADAEHVQVVVIVLHQALNHYWWNCKSLYLISAYMLYLLLWVFLFFFSFNYELDVFSVNLYCFIMYGKNCFIIPFALHHSLPLSLLLVLYLWRTCGNTFWVWCWSSLLNAFWVLIVHYNLDIIQAQFA